MAGGMGGSGTFHDPLVALGVGGAVATVIATMVTTAICTGRRWGRATMAGQYHQMRPSQLGVGGGVGTGGSTTAAASRPRRRWF